MELREAIEKAGAFAREALPNVEKLSTEEVEYDDKKSEWRITFGYKRELPRKRLSSMVGATAAIAQAMRPEFIEYEDVYRVIIIPENLSKHISMKIRKYE